jgi:hypothetical protein
MGENEGVPTHMSCSRGRHASRGLPGGRRFQADTRGCQVAAVVQRRSLWPHGRREQRVTPARRGAARAPGEAPQAGAGVVGPGGGTAGKTSGARARRMGGDTYTTTPAVRGAQRHAGSPPFCGHTRSVDAAENVRGECDGGGRTAPAAATRATTRAAVTAAAAAAAPASPKARGRRHQGTAGGCDDAQR